MARRDDLDSLFEEEFSVDLDNEAVLKEKQARSEILDKVAEFCNLDRQDPRIQKEVMGMRLPAYNAPAKKSIEISLPWHSSTIPIADHEIVRGKLNKSLKPQYPSKPWSPKDFFGGSGYYVHNTQGLRSYPSGLFVPETSSTSFSFVRSDRPVYATASIRPIGPCQPTSAMAGPTFSYLRNPDPPISGGLYDFHGRLQSGLGRPHGGFQDFGYLDPYRPQAPHQLSGVQSGYFCPTALGSSASGPPGHGRHGQFDSGFIYQQAGRDSLLHPAALNCRSFPLVRVSGHNSPGKTHSRLSERDSRPPISSEPANTDRVVPAPRDRESYLQGLGDTRSRHVCDTVKIPASSVHVSSSGAKSPSGGCSVSKLAGEVNVHVSPIPPAQQGYAETTVHPGGGGDPCSPLVAVSVVVFTSTTSLCGTPSSSPLPSGSSVPAGPEVHLRRKVVPSARMEALMRHYKAAGFSDEVSMPAMSARPAGPMGYLGPLIFRDYGIADGKTESDI